jgi:ABC-type nitrate/sulfonate/bicarbonate transport system substrate-binding protein
MRGLRQSTFLGVVALVIPLAGCSDEGRTEVTVASLPSAFLAAMYVAERDGTFEKEGLDVNIVELQSGADGVAAAVSGSAQIADIGFDDLVTLTEEGENGLVMVHNLVRRVTLTLVMNSDKAKELDVTRDSPLEERYAALKGLRLGVTSTGAASDRYLRYYLREAGLDPEKDAEIIAIGDGSSLLAALETGQIDAYQLSPPTPYVAESEGFGTILIDGPAGDVPALSDFAYTGFAANRDWAKGNADTVRAFTRALNTAMGKVQKDAAGMAAEIAERMAEDDVAVLQRTLEALLPALSTDGCFDATAIRTTLTTMHDVGITPAEGDAAEGALWTNEYNDC